MIKQKNNQELSIEDELAEYLAKHQPQPGASAGPRPTSNDLLIQIAADDLKEEKNQKGKNKNAKQKNKKQVSFTKIFLVTLMKITFFVDKIKFKYSSLLSILAGLWSLCVALIYIGGVCAAVLLLNVYLNYPKYIEQYFKENNIELADWKINHYTFSKIELGNLKDKNRSFSIKKVTIQSNFSDFLRKKIKLVKLDGVAIDVVEKGDKYEYGSLIDLLLKLNNSSRFGYHIDSIQITESVVTLKGKKYSLPIQFNTTGFYENNTNITVPFTIKHKNVNVLGKLTVTGASNNLDWTVDILSGNVSFLSAQQENVTGQFKFKTSKNEIASINGNLDMVFGKNKKSIKVDLKRSRKLFRGTVGMTLINQEVANKTDETKTELSLVFDGLHIKHLTLLESSQSIRFNVQSFASQDFYVSNASGILKGKLKCQDFVCTYQVTGNVPVNIQSVKASYYGHTYTSKGRVAFTIKPDKKENIRLASTGANVNVSLSDFVYGAYRDVTTADVKLNAKKIDLKADLGNDEKKSVLNLKMDKLEYETPEIRIKDALVDVKDVWVENTDFSLKTKEMQVKNSSLIKTPFAVDLKREKGVIRGDLKLLNDVIVTRFAVFANLLTGELQGNFIVNPIDLKNIPGKLNNYFTFIPEYVVNATGKVSLNGRVDWKNEKQIDGPFNLYMDNVGFDIGKTKVRGLTTALRLEKFTPFVSESKQGVFVKKIENVIPLQNITMMVQFKEQMAALNPLNMQIAGMNIGIKNALIPYQRSSRPLLLDNDKIDLETVNSYLNIPGLSMKGNATIKVPLEFKDGDLTFSDIDIKLNNVDLTYTGNDPALRNDLFLGGDTYIVRSGSVILSPRENTIDAFFSFDGRLEGRPIKTPYRKTITFNPSEIIKPMPVATFPLNSR